MKTKNTFAKLRRKLKQTINELNKINRDNSILSLEVKKLEKILDIQQKQAIVLDNQLIVEANRTSNLTNSLITTKEDKDWYYEQWIKDHSKIKIWKRIAYAGITFGIIITILNIILIKS